MKTLSKLLAIFLLVVVAGAQSKAVNSSKVEKEVCMLEGCTLSSSEIGYVQTALANYVAGFTFSYVVNHMTAINVSSCDGDIPMGGTITLDIDDEPVTWNWERQSGGSNVILIWPS
jgi:hypothetical protein